MNTERDTSIDVLMNRQNEVSHYIGISHGQIERSLKENMSNVSLENFQHARTVTMVNKLYSFKI